MGGFERTLDELFDARRPALAARRRLRRGRARAPVGAAPRRRGAWSGSTSRRSRSRPAGPSAQAPNLEYRVMQRGEPAVRRRTSSTWRARSRCSSTSPTPSTRVAEMARCAERHLLVSVPREPLWRMLNMARGAYWSDLGNTPGHLNHWSRRVVRGCSRATARSRRSARRSPGRCCLSASSRGLRGPPDALIRQRRAHPVDRDRLDRAADVRLLLDRQPRPGRGRPSASTCCGR